MANTDLIRIRGTLRQRSDRASQHSWPREKVMEQGAYPRPPALYEEAVELDSSHARRSNNLDRRCPTWAA